MENTENAPNHIFLLSSSNPVSRFSLLDAGEPLKHCNRRATQSLLLLFQESNYKIMKSRSYGKVSAKWVPIFSLCFFFLDMFFANKLWVPLESNNQLIAQQRREQELQIVSKDCTTKKKKAGGQDKNVMNEVYKTHEAIQSLDKSISMLQMELAVTRGVQEKGRTDDPAINSNEGSPKKKAFGTLLS